MTIAENIKAVEEKIAAAAEKSGRKKEDILLLAVTKTIDEDKMREALNLGYNEFGENKPQEINRKYFDFENDGVKWHQIGHLQTNKVKYIIDKVCLIHSLDSLKLAEEINKRAEKNNITMEVLIEINIGNEEAKSGVSYDDAEKLALEVSRLKNVKVAGLMCIAPFTDDKDYLRQCFKKMNKLFVDIKSKKYDNIDMKYLSMGMTNDYEIAIEEGSNIVRIGTGIFGARNYNL
ncbi:MAG: YggS family pyridoxal phosphate-dependent enzyme [Lachnospirales bacterium]